MQKLLILVCCMVMGGCSMVVTAPEVSLQQIAVTGADSDGMDLEAHLQIYNPNSFDIILHSYSYSLQIMGLPVNSGDSRSAITFPGGEMTLIPVPARVRHSQLLELLKRSPDPDRIPYRITASLQAETPFGELLIPVDRKSAFAIPHKYRPDNIFRQLKKLLVQP